MFEVTAVGMRYSGNPVDVYKAFRFVREPENPHDNKAIAVLQDNKRVAYIARDFQHLFTDDLDTYEAKFTANFPASMKLSVTKKDS